MKGEPMDRERMAEIAVGMRKEGAKYRDIGKRLGVSASIAANLVYRASGVEKYLTNGDRERRRLEEAKRSAAERHKAKDMPRQEAAALALRLLREGKGLWEAAEAAGTKPWTLQRWLKGTPELKRATENFQRCIAEERAALERTLKEVAGSRFHCGITGKRCEKATRCQYAASESSRGSEETRIEMCDYAIMHYVTKCAFCPRYGAGCLQRWTCWKLNLGERSEAICASLHHGSHSVFDDTYAVSTSSGRRSRSTEW